MSQLNAWVIQETLKKERRITLPWVQYTFQVPYSTSVWMLEQMVLRGWVEAEEDGCHWRVNRKNLCLRRLKKTECAALLKHLTKDCLSALDSLRLAHGKPMTAKAIEAAVRGHSDTVEAIRTLLEMNLVYLHGEYAFPTLSARESWALSCAVRSCIRRRVSERCAPEEAEEHFRKVLWDHLGEGESAVEVDESVDEFEDIYGDVFDDDDE